MRIHFKAVLLPPRQDGHIVGVQGLLSKHMLEFLQSLMSSPGQILQQSEPLSSQVRVRVGSSTHQLTNEKKKELSLQVILQALEQVCVQMRFNDCMGGTS